MFVKHKKGSITKDLCGSGSVQIILEKERGRQRAAVRVCDMSRCGGVFSVYPRLTLTVAGTEQ